MFISRFFDYDIFSASGFTCFGKEPNPPAWTKQKLSWKIIRDNLFTAEFSQQSNPLISIEHGAVYRYQRDATRHTYAKTRHAFYHPGKIEYIPVNENLYEQKVTAAELSPVVEIFIEDQPYNLVSLLHNMFTQSYTSFKDEFLSMLFLLPVHCLTSLLSVILDCMMELVILLALITSPGWIWFASEQTQSKMQDFILLVNALLCKDLLFLTVGTIILACSLLTKFGLSLIKGWQPSMEEKIEPLEQIEEAHEYLQVEEYPTEHEYSHSI